MAMPGFLNRQRQPDPQHFTPEEEADLQRCVAQVRRGFLVAGQALKEIRDKQLYRKSHGTFAEFCEQMFGMGDRRAYQLIEAAETAAALKDATLAPTNEAQLRPLAHLAPADQVETWQRACDVAGGQPTAPQVKASLPIDKARKKRSKKIKTTRLRLPGGTILVTPNRAFTTLEALLLEALAKVRRPEAA